VDDEYTTCAPRTEHREKSVNYRVLVLDELRQSKDDYAPRTEHREKSVNYRVLVLDELRQSKDDE